MGIGHRVRCDVCDGTRRTSGGRRPRRMLWPRRHGVAFNRSPPRLRCEGLDSHSPCCGCAQIGRPDACATTSPAARCLPWAPRRDRIERCDGTDVLDSGSNVTLGRTRHVGDDAFRVTRPSSRHGVDAYRASSVRFISPTSASRARLLLSGVAAPLPVSSIAAALAAFASSRHARSAQATLQREVSGEATARL